MLISGLNSVYGVHANEKLYGVRVTEKNGFRESGPVTGKDAQENPGQREDSLEISLEARLAAAEGQGAQRPDGADAEESVISGQMAADEPDTSEKTAVDEPDTSEKTGADEPDTSEKTGGKVGVNEGKRARQIAAAKNRGQVQQVLALLQKDLADCKAGLEKGWCDESEIAKVEALINQAKARLSEVPQESSQEKGQGGLDEFAMASLM